MTARDVRPCGPRISHMLTDTKAPDLLRRFTPTPFAADLSVMGCLIRLETNSLTILNHAKLLFNGYNQPGPRHRGFLWRIVSESDPDEAAEWPEMTVLSQEGLSCAAIGRRGFLAVDAKERQAVAFLPEALARDKTGFSHPFLAMLFTQTAQAVRLTSIPAACVARDEAGLLIFGRPQSGKTVCSYLATRFGLQFIADQMVFLDGVARGLRAWGEFWPALFYEDSQAFLPELPAAARRLHYHAQTYFYTEKPRQADVRRWVTPVACVVLERQNVERCRLIPLEPSEFRGWLNEYDELREGEYPQRTQHAGWELLRSLPSFRLTYGSDPSLPARVFRDLIEHQGPVSGSI